jgi:hypothetical protein
MSEPDLSDPQVKQALARQIAQCSTLTMNVAQRALIITEDRLELCLVKNLSRVGKSREWVGPLGNVVTVAAVLFTATFKDKIFSASVWEALFWLLLFWFLYQLALSVYAATKSLRTEELVELIRIHGNQGSTKESALVLGSSETSTRTNGASDATQGFQCSMCGALLTAGHGNQTCPSCGTMNVG